ncbi:MAG: hypothetical protein H6815_03635 [Phycisphaeraceae bacterium]|nr:hypothetical protein [Phycisphaerales bacterium]MCB9859520.1 hypothetical protein [Phycisphaeraceae bacterium]
MTIISKSKWILRLVKLRLVRLFLIVAVIGFYLGTRPWYLGGFAKPPIFSTITDPRPGATGTLEVLVWEQHVRSLWPIHSHASVTITEHVPPGTYQSIEDETVIRQILESAQNPTYRYFARESNRSRILWKGFLLSGITSALIAVAILLCIVLIVNSVLQCDVEIFGTCHKCGYSLRGLRDPICPECGAAIKLASQRHSAEL